MANIRQLVSEWVSGGGCSLATASTLLAVDTEQAQYADTVALFLGCNTSLLKAHGVEVFSDPQNLPTAIASIMSHSQDVVYYHPVVQSPELVSERFYAYLVGIYNTPFFHLIRNDFVKQSFQSKDYNQLIEQVVSLYHMASESDRDKLECKINEMAKSVLSQSHTDHWNNLFSITSIDCSNAKQPKISIYYASLRMAHEELAKSEVLEQEYIVNRVEYIVLSDLIHLYAEELSCLSNVHIGDWIENSSSPQNSVFKLCFENVSG